MKAYWIIFHGVGPSGVRFLDIEARGDEQAKGIAAALADHNQATRYKLYARVPDSSAIMDRIADVCIERGYGRDPR